MVNGDRGQTSISPMVGGKRQPLYNKDVQLTWICTKQGGHAFYQALATGPAGSVMSKKIQAYSKSGHEIIPFKYIHVDTKADDPHRVRVDSCKNVDFGQPKVTVLPQNAYYGEEGFIDNPDFLI